MKKSIDLMLNNIALEKAMMELYPNLEIKYVTDILKFLNYTKSELSVSEAKAFYKIHIPKIHDIIDWELYYEYCIINDYLIKFEQKTGLIGSDLLRKISNNTINYFALSEMTNDYRNKRYDKFIELFKKHYSDEMIDSHSLTDHKRVIDRKNKLKSILKR